MIWAYNMQYTQYYIIMHNILYIHTYTCIYILFEEQASKKISFLREIWKLFCINYKDLAKQ